ncbi:MAG TPA: nucleoside monophosphate kinase, partial [bacterium]|nr:nucleoside monophosphate kinase [bacterium]
MPEPAAAPALAQPAAPNGQPIRAVFFGPPGAGKGTQANIMAARYGLPVMDMGATIRKAIKDETASGLKARAYVEKGELVPPGL